MLGFVVPLFIFVVVNMMLSKCLYINDLTHVMD